MAEAKRILVVPMEKKVEALRMASGLTLLDDQVSVYAWGDLPAGADTEAQLEALDFADVPVERLAQDLDVLAGRMLDSDVVFLV